MSEVWDEAWDEDDVKKEILLDENVPFQNIGLGVWEETFLNNIYVK